MKRIGAVLSGTGKPPVRAGSHRLGSCERGWWRGMAQRDARRIVLAARKYDLAGRAKGARNGPLGHVALELLDLLANLMDRRTGRLEPALAWLVMRLKRSRDAICRALTRLREHGFLDWLRRFAPVQRDGPGPRVKQASNAYRITMPPRADRLLTRPAPMPDPEPPRDAPPMTALDEALERMAFLREQRESAGREEPLAESTRQADAVRGMP